MFKAWGRDKWGAKVGVRAKIMVRPLCSPRPLFFSLLFPRHPPPQGGYFFLAQRVYRVFSLIAYACAPQRVGIESLTTRDHMGAVISLSESPLEGRVPPLETKLNTCPLVAPSRPLPSSFFLPPIPLIPSCCSTSTALWRHVFARSPTLLVVPAG